MCAYAPGITYTGGESIARSLDSAFSDIAGGIMERSKKRQEKEQLAAATKALQPLVEKLAPGSGVDLTKDVPKEAIPQFIQLAGQISEQQRIAPLRDLQLENEKLRQRISQQQIDEAATNAAALPDAAAGFSGGDYRGAMGNYLSKGGRDPRILAELGDLAQAQAKAAGTPKPLVFASEKDLQARYPAEKYDYTMIPDPATGAVRVDKVSPRAPAQSNLPPGYEMDPATPGAIRPIKGSEGDMKRKEAEKSAGNRLQSELARSDVILTAIDQVLPKVGGYTAGFGGTALAAIPGTDAKDVSSVIDTIKANIGFEQLQRMREASPTGGALGQVAVQELNFLQAALGNLSTQQSPARLQQTLKEIQTRYRRWQQASQGTNPDETSPAAAPSAQSGLSADSVLSKWIKQ